MELLVLQSPYLGWLAAGALMTALLAAASLLVAVPLTLAVSLARDARAALPRLAAVAYVDLLRSLPPVPLLLLATAALPPRWHLPALVAVLAANAAAYLAESLRAGAAAVGARQREAARTLGMGALRLHWHVVWPQAVRTAWPDITTRLIHLLKNTSIAAVLPLALAHQELFGQAARIAGETFAWEEPLLAVWLVLLAYVGALHLACRAIGARLRRAA